MRGLFLDFEATDKDVATARITQVAFSVFDLDTQKELYHYSTLVNPTGEYEINPTAQAITGITKEQLSEFGIPLEDALDALISRLAGVEILVAHNLHNYDLPLLKNELARLGYSEFKTPLLVDTRFDVPWPEHIETRKLTYLAAEYGIVNPSAHSARHDVDLLAKLFLMHDISKTLERAKSPMIWVRADVNYNDREKAKEKRFHWNADKKIWIKQFKQCDFEKEIFCFKCINLPSDFLP